MLTSEPLVPVGSFGSPFPFELVPIGSLESLVLAQPLTNFGDICAARRSDLVAVEVDTSEA